MSNLIEDIELRTNLAKITMKSVFDRPGIASLIFSSLGEAGFNVETIAQTGTTKDRCDISFTVKDDEVDMVLEHLRKKLTDISATGVLVDKNVALVTIFGKELVHTPGFAGRVFSILANKGINIEMISASLSILSCIIPKDKASEAMETIKAELK
ncbi:MAG: ACT domain-containing protein [bacterium]